MRRVRPCTNDKSSAKQTPQFYHTILTQKQPVVPGKVAKNTSYLLTKISLSSETMGQFIGAGGI